MARHLTDVAVCVLPSTTSALSGATSVLADATSVLPDATSVLPDAATYALFLAAAVALILTPGPDTLFVLSQGVQSRALGVRAALGVALGVLLHTGLAVLGLAALYRTVPEAESLVRLLGGAYLLYLGVATLRNADEDTGGEPATASMADGPGTGTATGSGETPAEATATGATGETTAPSATEASATAPSATGETTTHSATGGLRRGFLVNALNPQVALFFLAFLPGFASGPAAGIQMGVLGATYAAITAVYLAGVAVLADGTTRRIAAPRAGRWLNRVAGGVLLVLGVWLLSG